MKENWQSNVIPKECIKFRLDKKEGSVAINGVEVHHTQNAQELVNDTPTGNLSRKMPLNVNLKGNF